MNREPEWMTVNGAQLYVQDIGSGFPIVLVHAGIAHSGMWDEQFQFLAENYRVVAYDLRGYGNSPPTSGDFAHYLDLVALLDHLGINECILVGCSKGAGVILDAAVYLPSRVAGLILVAGSAHGLELTDPPDPPPQWQKAIEAYQAGDLVLTNELEIQIWMDGYNQRVGRANKNLRNRVKRMNQIVLENAVAVPDAVERVLEPKAGTRLNEISAPTLMISGSLDDPYILRALDLTAGLISGARHETIQDAAHLPNMEKPGEFNALIENFIRQVVGRE